MGFRLDYKEKNDDNVALLLESIQGDCEDLEDKVLEKMKSVGKRIVISELNAIKRQGKLNKNRIKHMCEEVQSTVRKDSWGFRSLKIKGGKKTGTLWHIVNDGTYRTKPTHFIDKAMDKIDSETERIIDETIKKGS